MDDIYVPAFSNIEPIILEQEITKLPITDRHSDDLPLSEEDDTFLHDSNRLQLPSSDIQRMIDYTMPRCGENTMRGLSDWMNQEAMETLFKLAGNKSTTGILSPVYGGVEDIVKQAVNCDSENSTIRWRLGRAIESQRFAQNIVGCLMRTPLFTASITKLSRRYAEVAIMN